MICIKLNVLWTLHLYLDKEFRRRFIRIREVFLNQACLWGSYSKEGISVKVGRESRYPVMQYRVPHRSWYQDLGTHPLWQKCTHLFAATTTLFVRGQNLPISSGPKCTHLFAATTTLFVRGQNIPISSGPKCTHLLVEKNVPICSRQNVPFCDQDPGTKISS